MRIYRKGAVGRMVWFDIRLTILIVFAGVVAFGSGRTGSLDFSSAPIDERVAPRFVAMAASRMAAGDGSYAALTISNESTAAIGYTIVASTTDPGSESLSGELRVEVRRVEGSCDASSFASSKVSIAPPQELRTMRGAAVRPVEPGSREVACLKVSLSPNVPPRLAQRTTWGTFTVLSRPL